MFGNIILLLIIMMSYTYIQPTETDLNRELTTFKAISHNIIVKAQLFNSLPSPAVLGFNGKNFKT